MKHRQSGAAASLMLALARLLAGALGAVPLAAGKGPPQGDAPPEAAISQAATEETGTAPPAATGRDPSRLPSRIRPSAQLQSRPLAPSALTMSYWIWIASAEPAAYCGWDWGGVAVNRYYLRVERVSGSSTTQPYALRAVFR